MFVGKVSMSKQGWSEQSAQVQEEKSTNWLPQAADAVRREGTGKEAQGLHRHPWKEPKMSDEKEDLFESALVSAAWPMSQQC